MRKERGTNPEKGKGEQVTKPKNSHAFTELLSSFVFQKQIASDAQKKVQVTIKLREAQECTEKGYL